MQAICWAVHSELRSFLINVVFLREFAVHTTSFGSAAAARKCSGKGLSMRVQCSIFLHA